MSTKPTDFEKALVIDRNNLDQELIRHADIFYRVAEAYMTAIDKRDTAKDNLGKVDAEIGLKLRKRAETKAEKMTEIKLQSMLQVDTTHTKAVDRYLRAKAEADKFGVLKESFQQKSYMLRSMVDLYTANYYSIESGGSKSANVVASEVRKKIAAKRNIIKGH